MSDCMKGMFVDEEFDKRLRAAFRHWYAKVHDEHGASEPDQRMLDAFCNDMTDRVVEMGRHIVRGPGSGNGRKSRKATDD